MGFVKMATVTFNYFLQQGHGQLAVLSSVAALRGNSWTPAYSASKAYVSNYAEGLNIKARKLHANIVITDIRPGFVKTKMAKGTVLGSAGCYSGPADHSGHRRKKACSLYH
jgi:short-subunit dehydrogenase